MMVNISIILLLLWAGNPFMSSSKKLSAIRSFLKRNTASALFIPHSDAFQNEYISPSDERIQWLSGFSGSAGFCIVTPKAAAVFTDGRYTLQLKQQVDGSLFDCKDFKDMERWIFAHIEPCTSVLYDPWLFSVADSQHWQKKLEKIQAIFTSTESKDVDAFWNDRPLFVPEPAFLHDVSYCGKEFTDKHNQMCLFLENHGLAHYLWGSSESLNWLLNIRGYDLSHTPVKNMYGIFHKDGTIDIFTHLSAIPEIIQNRFNKKVFFHDLSALSETFADFRPLGKVGFDPKFTPKGLYDLILDEHALCAKDDPCILWRSIKNETEQASMRQCHIRDGAALVNFLHWLDTLQNQEEFDVNPLTEIQIADTLDAFRQQQSLFHSLSFSTISGFGENGAIIHYKATPETNKSLSKGNLLLLDSGAQYLDGTTDVTRTLAIGTPTSDHQLYFTRVLKGHIALAKAIFPKGTTGEQLDALARQFLWEIGADYAHGTGHGVGFFLNVHEGPQRISPKSQTHVPLVPGMVISNEPGFYKENDFGIRIESLVMVQEYHSPNTEKGTFLCFETLTMAPIDTKLIALSLMTSDEIAWLNQYHETVYHTLAPHVSASTRKWLFDHTKPI